MSTMSNVQQKIETSKALLTADAEWLHQAPAEKKNCEATLKDSIEKNKAKITTMATMGSKSTVASHGSHATHGGQSGLERKTEGALKVEVSAETIQPRLTLDKVLSSVGGREPVLKFVVWSTNQNNPKHITNHRSFTLTNRLPTDMTFALSTSFLNSRKEESKKGVQPFSVVRLKIEDSLQH